MMVSPTRKSHFMSSACRDFICRLFSGAESLFGFILQIQSRGEDNIFSFANPSGETVDKKNRTGNNSVVNFKRKEQKKPQRVINQQMDINGS